MVTVRSPSEVFNSTRPKAMSVERSSLPPPWEPPRCTKVLWRNVKTEPSAKSNSAVPSVEVFTQSPGFKVS